MNRYFTAILLFLITAAMTHAVNRPTTEHIVYFANTDYQLDVYRHYGAEDGKTVMLLGGIQGDEPGGYLSADAYVNLRVRKGNLIVVPRANFHSILVNQREVNADMNRLFFDHPIENEEDRVVEIIKSLMTEADLFLNLHDGWGYYADTYVNQNRNPHRFGQSIIADASVFTFNGTNIELENMAKTAMSQANEKISNPDYFLNFMNTRTMADDTPFPEMRKSATYYALTTLGIPAFGIESSKNISDNERKAYYHIYAINAFLEMSGIEFEYPFLAWYPAENAQIAVRINGSILRLFSLQDSLFIQHGDRLLIESVIADPGRGLIANFIGTGNWNDLGVEQHILQSTRIEIRQDAAPLGFIPVIVRPFKPEYVHYIFSVNGQKVILDEKQTLTVKRSDNFTIEDVVGPGIASEAITVNLKGFVPTVTYNTGEDRHHIIPVNQLNWKKYSVNGDGKMYPIIVSLGSQQISSINISIE